MAKKKVKKQRRRMRLLPMTVTMLSLLFVIKMNELYIGSERLRDMYGVRDAVAEEKKEEASHGAEAKKEEAGHGEAPKDGAEKKEEGGHGEAKEEEGGHGGGSAKPVPEERTYGTGKSTVKDIEALKTKDAQPQFSASEVEVLQRLSKRREDLDAREKEIDLKLKVLEATDKRIADKITEMKVLEAELTKVIAQYNEKQDAQIKSLVKIYENMKPDEAANIFNELEMPILLEVISKMSERKVAPVLANMSPKRARDVTQELAEKRKKASAIAAGQAPAR